MTKEEEINKLLELFHNNRPGHTFEKINKKEIGIFAVIKYLHDSTKEINSKDISKHLNISSARTTILLQKLENKKLIIKTNSKSDARAIIIKLSDKGFVYANKMKEQIHLTMSKVLDEFTIKEVEEIFLKLNKFKLILNENLIDKMEGIND